MLALFGIRFSQIIDDLLAMVEAKMNEIRDRTDVSHKIVQNLYLLFDEALHRIVRNIKR